MSPHSVVSAFYMDLLSLPWSQVRSVGNTVILRETALIEAFNLKAAIEYVLKNQDAAKEALSDMPPR